MECKGGRTDGEQSISTSVSLLSRVNMNSELKAFFVYTKSNCCYCVKIN